MTVTRVPASNPEPNECPKSQRGDGKHAWHFDGDDPYVICHWCDRMQDAISGGVIREGS